jgi:purine-nucleoside phosphorylase
LEPTAVAVAMRQALGTIPELAIVLGSGFQRVVASVEVEAAVDYRDLPGFPRPTVAGHAGRVCVGRLGGERVLWLSGRAHYYEGYTAGAVTFPVRVLAALGVRRLLLTNAAGGIDPRHRPGDFMILTDHINLVGVNPLRGQVAAGGMSGFVDMTEAYDPGLRRRLREAGRASGVRVHSGVYVAVSGPSYETPAEIRAFARLGAQAVGMSTVFEAIVARQCGMRVAGLSCIANRAAGLGGRALDHAEVLAVGDRTGEKAVGLLGEFVRRSGGGGVVRGRNKGH